MQKLKNTVLDKMLTAHLTKAEVDFMIEISHYQDDSGKVYGVYYKDVCEAIGIKNLKNRFFQFKTLAYLKQSRLRDSIS